MNSATLPSALGREAVQRRDRRPYARLRPRVLRTVLSAVLGAAVLSAATCVLASHLLCNLTRSMPLGLYWLHRGAPVARGDVVAFSVPAAVRPLVRERHYLVERAWLLKPVAAVAGDTVCIAGDELAIRGYAVARLRTSDSEGRPLPRDARCGVLPEQSLYVLASDPRSFDSRVFGPIDRRNAIATVTPLWTF